MYAGRYHLGQVWTGPTRHFVDQHVPKETGACGFAAGEEVFRRRRDKCVWTDLERLTGTWTQPPEGSSMGEGDGVHKRRMFRWPKEARELVREYKERTSRSQEHNETRRRMLVTKLVV